MILDQRTDQIYRIKTAELKADKNIGDLIINKTNDKVFLFGNNTIVGTVVVNEGELICLA
jgi:hypothetical protein